MDINLGSAINYQRDLSKLLDVLISLWNHQNYLDWVDPEESESEFFFLLLNKICAMFKSEIGFSWS